MSIFDRFERGLLRRQRQVKRIGRQTDRLLEREFFQRFGRLWHVRRFVTVWVLIIVFLMGGVIVQTHALSGYYQRLEPAPGGLYTEGIVGAYTNANPIYATGEVDEAVSHLIFASLLKYNNQNQLTGDLADQWQLQDNGLQYLVHLRPHLSWQDGKPLTASDVVFTFQTIQNPDAQSPFVNSWQGVTVTALDNQTVLFTLPNPLASFPASLTMGIIPQHILGSVPTAQMRSAAFNTTEPVGAGPFAINGLQVTGGTPETREERVALKPFNNYYGGKPKLNEFTVHAFASQTSMRSSFDKEQISAMVGLDSVPAKLAKNKSVKQYKMPLTAGTYVFFKTSEGVLADAKVRQALVQGSDTATVLSKLGSNLIPVDEPLLRGQLAYNAKYSQLAYNVAAAQQELTADGWMPGAGGIRYKKGQPLMFNLFAQNTSQYTTVTHDLQQEWRQLGASVQVYLQPATDLQPTLQAHSYDALLYGISIGIDPDVYAYWDSSQADPRAPGRLNFSEYKSTVADQGLEAGRTRTDAALRVIKYQPFLQAWQQDAPALGLYQPDFLYVTHGTVYGLHERTINAGIDRYQNVQNWEIRAVPTTIK